MKPIDQGVIGIFKDHDLRQTFEVAIKAAKIRRLTELWEQIEHKRRR